jgi:hypothetical protein
VESSVTALFLTYSHPSHLRILWSANSCTFFRHGSPSFTCLTEYPLIFHRIEQSCAHTAGFGTCACFGQGTVQIKVCRARTAGDGRDIGHLCLISVTTPMYSFVHTQRHDMQKPQCQCLASPGRSSMALFTVEQLELIRRLRSTDISADAVFEVRSTFEVTAIRLAVRGPFLNDTKCFGQVMCYACTTSCRACSFTRIKPLSVRC